MPLFTLFGPDAIDYRLSMAQTECSLVTRRSKIFEFRRFRFAGPFHPASVSSQPRSSDVALLSCVGIDIFL